MMSVKLNPIKSIMTPANKEPIACPTTKNKKGVSMPNEAFVINTLIPPHH